MRVKSSLPGENRRQENGGPEEEEAATGAPVVMPNPLTVVTITWPDWSATQASPAFIPFRDELIATDPAPGIPPGNGTIVLAGAVGGDPSAGNAMTANPPLPLAASVPR